MAHPQSQGTADAAKPGLTVPAAGATWSAALRPYGIAFAAIAAALAVRLALESVLAGQASYLFFLPAVLIASAVGGWGPGSLPPYSAWSADWFS